MLFVITSINILLSLSIAFTYYFVSIGLFFQYIKSYFFISKNWFSYIALLKSVPAVILLLRNISAVVLL